MSFYFDAFLQMNRRNTLGLLTLDDELSCCVLLGEKEQFVEGEHDSPTERHDVTNTDRLS